MALQMKSTTMRILLGLAAALGIIYAISGISKDYTAFYDPLLGVALGTILIVEAFRKEYIRLSTYKSLSAPQIFGLITLVLGTTILYSGISGFSFVGVGAVPQVVSNFISSARLIIGGLGALFATIHIVWVK